jgi:hypothetical protein
MSSFLFFLDKSITFLFLFSFKRYFVSGRARGAHYVIVIPRIVAPDAHMPGGLIP